VAHFRVKVGGQMLNIFAADLGAPPFLPRGPQIDMLAGLTSEQPRTLVMGDFNTPLESVHLASMRAHFTEAMDGPHRGFRETWFYNLPMLSLDHVWLSSDLEPVFTSRRLTLASDHDPVVVNFKVLR
jgi:endonuclease/exonuclease/phosphatase (EEP) superfamily protein YafD